MDTEGAIDVTDSTKVTDEEMATITITEKEEAAVAAPTITVANIMA